MLNYQRVSGILGMIGMTFGPLAPILGHLDHHQFPEQMALLLDPTNSPRGSIFLRDPFNTWKSLLESKRSPNKTQTTANLHHQNMGELSKFLVSQDEMTLDPEVLKALSWSHKDGMSFPNRRALTDFI